MLSRCAATILATLLLAPATHAQLPGQGFAENAELVANFPIGPSSGAKLVGDFFYITTGNSLYIYDVKQAEAPVEVGSAQIPSPDPQAQRAPEEDPDTNGKILLMTYPSEGLIVWDVSDKTAPKVLSTLPGVEEHTISCVLDCTWAYGSEGAIIDLRDPKTPKEAGSWLEVAEAGSTHDITEVAPGIIATSTEPIAILDARDNPAAPKKLAGATPPGFVHAIQWPHQMADRIMLVGGEALGPQCAGNKDATFQTWDTTNWRQDGFRLIDEYTLDTGVPPATGTMPAVTFCVHWFEPNASYRDGGLVGIGWYENGTRFLKIGLDGSIEELGYFIPLGTRSSGVYFRNDRIAYVADYYRGFDVVKYTGDLPPSAAAPAPAIEPPLAPAPANTPRARSFSDLVKLPARCTRRRLRIGLRKTDDPVTRLTVRVGKAKAKRYRKAVTLKKLPRRRFTLQVQARTRSGHTTAGQRTYRGCR